MITIINLKKQVNKQKVTKIKFVTYPKKTCYLLNGGFFMPKF